MPPPSSFPLSSFLLRAPLTPYYSQNDSSSLLVILSNLLERTPAKSDALSSILFLSFQGRFFPHACKAFFFHSFSTPSVCLPLFLFLEMEIRGGKREEEKRGMKFLRLYLSYFREEIPGTPFFPHRFQRQLGIFKFPCTPPTRCCCGECKRNVGTSKRRFFSPHLRSIAFVFKVSRHWNLFQGPHFTFRFGFHSHARKILFASSSIPFPLTKQVFLSPAFPQSSRLFPQNIEN